MVLVRPVGTILPDAVAIMSTRPKVAHAIAIIKNRIIKAPIARPTGDAGVSRISSAAGRNWRAVSWRLRRDPLGFEGSGTASADDMQPRLYLVEGGVTSRLIYQLIMGAIFDEPPGFDGDDAVGMPHGRQAMGDDEHRPAGGD